MVGSVQRVRRDTVRWRGGWARLGPRRGATDVALLTVAASSPIPREALERCLHRLHDAGYDRVITSALLPRDAAPFADVGFELHESLHLLVHDLTEIASARIASRRLRDTDVPAVLRVDGVGFDEFWRFDAAGLQDAIQATPAHRARVVPSSGNDVQGYAVTGRSGDVGYLQRLAVAPDQRRRGVGFGLVVDGLRWLRRHGAQRAYVNTQYGNAAAVRLYERSGFVHADEPLIVLGRRL